MQAPDRLIGRFAFDLLMGCSNLPSGRAPVRFHARGKAGTRGGDAGRGREGGRVVSPANGRGDVAHALRA